MGPNKESTSGVESAAGEADAATLAAMDTAAGTPATEPTETFDTRVNDVTVGHFRLGLSLRDVLQATLENQYIPSKTWPTTLEQLIEGGIADGNVKFYRLDDSGMVGYRIEFCGARINRLVEQREYSDVSRLNAARSQDAAGPFADLREIQGAAAAESGVVRAYKRVYDSGRSARIRVAYDPADPPTRKITISDGERCRLSLSRR